MFIKKIKGKKKRARKRTKQHQGWEVAVFLFSGFHFLLGVQARRPPPITFGCIWKPLASLTLFPLFLDPNSPKETSLLDFLDLLSTVIVTV